MYSTSLFPPEINYRTIFLEKGAFFFSRDPHNILRNTETVTQKNNPVVSMRPSDSNNSNNNKKNNNNNKLYLYSQTNNLRAFRFDFFGDVLFRIVVEFYVGPPYM